MKRSFGRPPSAVTLTGTAPTRACAGAAPARQGHVAAVAPSLGPLRRRVPAQFAQSGHVPAGSNCPPLDGVWQCCGRPARAA